MGKSLSKVFLVLAVLLAVTATAQAQSGRITGQVVDTDGHGMGGVAVAIDELGRATISDPNGRYDLSGVPPGTYTVTFTLNENVETVADVVVSAGETASLDYSVAWNVSFADTLTVYSASRRQERIVDAPAAVTHISEEEIEREASHGQLPKLLEFTPGAQVTQSGLYDFNFNTRGFNSSLNRRIVTLVDGRDPSVPFLGAQEWAAISMPLDDLASAELVRGPSSALYGANAFNGVLNLVSKQARYSEGGFGRLAGGELSTVNADLRQGGEIGGGWFYKVNGGYRGSDDFTVARVGTPQAVTQSEYGTTRHGLLPAERIAPVLDDDEIFFGGVRLDKYLDNGHVATVEGGYASIEGPVFQTGIGRVQLLEVDRPWFRGNYNAPHWNLLGYWNGRDAVQRSLQASITPTSPAGLLLLDDTNWQLELQGNQDFFDGRARLVAGASYGEEQIRTERTLTFADVDADFTAVFAQADFDITDRLKAVLAGRYDESNLHDSQFSPKGSLVFALTPNQTVRLTYNEAFQVANYSEFFLQAPVAAPLTSLAGLEAFLSQLPGFVPLGFGAIPVLAVGNANLAIEEIETWELGYSGVLGGRTLLTADYYNSTAENFISDLLPNVGPGGRLNPDFQFYTPPAALSGLARTVLLAQLQGLLAQIPALAALSNNFDGAPILVGATYTNFGEVDTEGIDVGLQWHVSRPWRWNLNYSWFDFEIVQAPSPQLEGQLKPNAPEHSFSTGLLYTVDRWDAGLNFRWVDGFDWSAGVFNGEVPSYELLDLVGNFRVTDSIALGVNVSNLTDEEHWQAFGGDVLGRRALGSI
ncbi:MAG TPA: TonB-dependent receptor, partial [Thermoanaerobaculia bacterium]|nr:TonB-dependent receptor [Thermoanaerobaculia bacterium]